MLRKRFGLFAESFFHSVWSSSKLSLVCLSEKRVSLNSALSFDAPEGVFPRTRRCPKSFTPVNMTFIYEGENLHSWKTKKTKKTDAISIIPLGVC